MPRRQIDPFETRDVKQIVDPDQKALTEIIRALIEQEGVPEYEAEGLAHKILHEIDQAMGAQPVFAHLRKAIQLLSE